MHAPGPSKLSALLALGTLAAILIVPTSIAATAGAPAAPPALRAGPDPARGTGAPSSGPTALPGTSTSSIYAHWVRLSPKTAPPPRQNANMVYDPADGYVVLFGGGTRNGPLYNDTWIYRNGSWSNLTPAHSPPYDTGSGMVYDSADGYVLYYDGTPCGGACGNTWKFHAGTWTNITPSLSPTARRAYAMGYDARDGETVLFGGENVTTSAYLNDTWVYAHGKWSKVATPHAPSPRADANEGGLSYDASAGYLVLFGGDSGYGGCPCYNETWKFANGSWTQLSPARSPPGRPYAAMAYDPQVQGLVMYGGLINIQPTTDTWVYTGGTWVDATRPNDPLVSYEPSATFDAAAGYLLLFGGGSCNCGNAYSNETWEYVLPTNFTVDKSAPFPGARWTFVVSRDVGGCTTASAGLTGRPFLNRSEGAAFVGAQADVLPCANASTVHAKASITLFVAGPRFTAGATATERVNATWNVTSSARVVGTYHGPGVVAYSAYWQITAALFDLTTGAVDNLTTIAGGRASAIASGGNLSGSDPNGSTYLNGTAAVAFGGSVPFVAGDIYVLHWSVRAVAVATDGRSSGAGRVSIFLGPGGVGATLVELAVG